MKSTILLLCIIIGIVATLGPTERHNCNENRGLVYRFSERSKSQNIGSDISSNTLPDSQASQLASIVSGAASVILEYDSHDPHFANSALNLLAAHPLVEPNQSLVIYDGSGFVQGLLSDFSGDVSRFLDQHPYSCPNLSGIEDLRATLVFITNGIISNNPNVLRNIQNEVYWISGDMSTERISTVHGLSGNRFGSDYFVLSLDQDKLGKDLTDVLSRVLLEIVDENSTGTVVTNNPSQNDASDFDCDERCTETGLVDWDLSCGQISPEIDLSKVNEALESQSSLLVEFMKSPERTISKMFPPRQLRNDPYFDKISTRADLLRYNDISFRNYRSLEKETIDSVEICVSDDFPSSPITKISLFSQLEDQPALEIFGSSSSKSWKYQDGKLCNSFEPEYLLEDFRPAQDLYLGIYNGDITHSRKLVIDWQTHSIETDSRTSPRLLSLISQPVVTTVSYSENVFVKVWGIIFSQGKEQFSISRYAKDFSQSSGNVYFDLGDYEPIFESFEFSFKDLGQTANAHYFELNLRSFDTLGMSRLYEKFSYALHLRSESGQEECVHLMLDIDLTKYSDKQTERWLGYKTVVFSDAENTDPIRISSSSGEHISVDDHSEQWIYGVSSISNSLYDLTFEGLSVCISDSGELPLFNPETVDHACTGVWKDSYSDGFEMLSQESQQFKFRVKSPKDKDLSVRINWDVIPSPGSAISGDRLFSDRFGDPLQMIGHRFEGSEFETMETEVHYILYQQKSSQDTYGFPYGRRHYSSEIMSEIDIFSGRPNFGLAKNPDNMVPNFAHIELLALTPNDAQNHQENARSISLFNYDDDSDDDDDNWFQAYFSSSSRTSKYISYLESILDSLVSSSTSDYSSEQEYYNETSPVTSESPTSYSSTLSDDASGCTNSSSTELGSGHTGHGHKHKHLIIWGIIIAVIIAIILVLICGFMCYRMYEESPQEIPLPRPATMTKTTQSKTTKTRSQNVTKRPKSRTQQQFVTR